MVRVKPAKKNLYKGYIATIVVAISVAFLIRHYVIEAYRVPSFAMKPTLLSGDTIFVAKWPVQFKKPYLPDRGDVVIFSSQSGPGAPQIDYIRRVVGLPGDEVEVQNGLVRVNGAPLVVPGSVQHTDSEANPVTSCSQEKTAAGKTYSVCVEKPKLHMNRSIKIPQNSVFVIGDLRTQQKGWGITPIVSLKGKALLVWLSIENSSERKTFSLPHLRMDRMFRRIE